MGGDGRNSPVMGKDGAVGSPRPVVGAQSAREAISGKCARSLLALPVFLAALAWAPALLARDAATLIVNVVVVDGSGTAGKRQAVRIRGDSILAIGDLAPGDGDAVIDGQGLVLAPGFIDTHSHHDSGLTAGPQAEVLLSQGVTTAVFGQDGDAGSEDGVARSLKAVLAERRAHRSAINYAYFAGHNTIRSRVLAKDWNREASARELEAMRRMLADDMRAGALGLSTGLEYDPGRASSHAEVMVLAKEAARFGGRYISHMRNEDESLFPAIEEVLAIGKEARIPVQISHIKLGGVAVWGRSGEVLARLDRARAEGIDVSADIYPYDRWHTAIISLFPGRAYKDPATTHFVLSKLVPPEGILIDDYRPEPELRGRTLADVAAARRVDPERLLVSMLDASGGMESDLTVMGRSMRDEDVSALMAWSEANICSDGAIGDRHPRGAGSFAKTLAHHVRETGSLTLAQAIRKMSGLAADHMGLRDRGYIRPGYKADMVLFDPATIQDHATFQRPEAQATGVMRVWVNGAVVWTGKPTGSLPGRYLPRASSRPRL